MLLLRHGISGKTYNPWIYQRILFERGNYRSAEGQSSEILARSFLMARIIRESLRIISQRHIQYCINTKDWGVDRATLYPKHARKNFNHKFLCQVRISYEWCMVIHINTSVILLSWWYTCFQLFFFVGFFYWNWYSCFLKEFDTEDILSVLKWFLYLWVWMELSVSSLCIQLPNLDRVRHTRHATRITLFTRSVEKTVWDQSCLNPRRTLYYVHNFDLVHLLKIIFFFCSCCVTLYSRSIDLS